MLAVFERLDLTLLERLLGAAAGEASLSFVKFVNQRKGLSSSVPDASISGSFRYVFEVKTVRGAPLADQVSEHLRGVLTKPDEEQRLFVLTPDAAKPKELAQITDPRVVWFSFLSLSQAIDAVLSSAQEDDSDDRDGAIRY